MSKAQELAGYGFCRVPTCGQRATWYATIEADGQDAGDVRLVGMAACDAHGRAFMSPEQAAELKADWPEEFEARLAAATKAIADTPIVSVGMIYGPPANSEVESDAEEEVTPKPKKRRKRDAT